MDRRAFVELSFHFARFAQPGEQRGRFRFRLFGADAVLEAGDHLDELEPHPLVGGQGRRDRVGRVDPGGGDREPESLRRDADDLVRSVVEEQGAAEDFLVAAELAGPQKAWLRITTCSRPGVSSSGRKARPSAGGTPSTPKSAGETRSAVSGRGGPGDSARPV